MYSIASFVRRHGFPCAVRGIVPDHEAAIRSAVSAEPDADVILLTGGVSVGEYDLVRTAVQAEGFEVLFDAVAIKPGKPMVFARKGRQLLFGLSGNPVSSLLQAARFLLPGLRRLAGWRRPGSTFVSAVLAADLRHRGDRTAYRPCRLVAEDGRLLCHPVKDKGSADLFAWRRINGLAVLPAEHPAVAAGELVQVFVLEPFNFLPAE
jgi:molybdopterin molybdotransferase